MPHSDSKPADAKVVRGHNEELELRMAKMGFVNPSRVAEIMRLPKPTVYRWLEHGHVSKRDIRGRVFAEVKSLHEYIRDPVMSEAINQFVVELIAKHEQAETIPPGAPDSPDPPEAA